MNTIRAEVVNVCHAIGLEVHGDQVYGPLDSIAILLDQLLFEDEQECSEALKLSALAQSIEKTPICASSKKMFDADHNL